VAASAKLYAQVFGSLASGLINYPTATARVMLATSAYVPNQDTHVYVSSVTGEASGTGYTAGGQALASKTVTFTSATNTTMLDCADPSWTTATFTFRYAVFYIDTGTPSSSPLISWMDFGSDQSATGGTVTITIPGTGIAQFVAAA
jgi:hypothetical protein